MGFTSVVKIFTHGWLNLCIENPWIQRANCFHFTKPFNIRDLSIHRFGYMWGFLESIFFIKEYKAYFNVLSEKLIDFHEYVIRMDPTEILFKIVSSNTKSIPTITLTQSTAWNRIKLTLTGTDGMSLSELV